MPLGRDIRSDVPMPVAVLSADRIQQMEKTNHSILCYQGCAPIGRSDDWELIIMMDKGLAPLSYYRCH
jgi:hypothetical protein